MTVTYTRINKDTVEQITTTPEIRFKFVQSEMQKSISDTQKKLDDMPAVKPYPTGATLEEQKVIDEWNIKNTNKFMKEGLQESINEQTKFLDMIKVVE